MNPRVSIIIPAYNAEKYIAQTIESVVKQTEQNIEVIVVDDGSSDGTVEVIRAFSDQRLKLIINESNQGVSYSRNRALQEARGEWVALLDADDWYAPERIKNLLEVACAENVDLIADDLYFMQDDVEAPIGTLLSVDKEHFNKLRFIDPVTFIELNMKPARQSPHLGLAKSLIRRDFLIKQNLKYNENLDYLEDFYFYLMCLLKGGRFAIYPEPYYFYRRYYQGAASKQHRLKRLKKSCQAHLLLLEENSVKDNPVICSLIEKNLININQELEYRRTIQTIKERRWLAALRDLVSNPLLALRFIKKIPEIFRNKFIQYTGIVN